MDPESNFNPWPALAYADWQDTCDTLHLWTQIVGKVKLALAPLSNHWWGVVLFVTARGHIVVARCRSILISARTRLSCTRATRANSASHSSPWRRRTSTPP